MRERAAWIAKGPYLLSILPLLPLRLKQKSSQVEEKAKRPKEKRKDVKDLQKRIRM